MMQHSPPMSMVDGDRCLVILPTYIERDNIRPLVVAALSSSPLIDVLVVDDNSPDGTANVVRAIAADEDRVSLLQRRKKLGLGSAYLAGFQRGLTQGYRFLCTMDADGSHDPAMLSAMMATLVRGEADMVIGSRYVTGSHAKDWSIARQLISRAANCLVRRLLRLEVFDCTSGYRVYSGALLQRMRLGSVCATGYSGLVELLSQARDAKARIVEHPIAFRHRRHGNSKMTISEILGSLRTVAVLYARA